MCLPPTSKQSQGGAKVAPTFPDLDERGRKLEALNSIVRRKLESAVTAAKLADKPLAAEFAAALRSKTPLVSGLPIYERRSAGMVIGYTIMAVGFVLSAWLRIGTLPIVLCAVTMFFGYDIYSGVLHIVLDCPRSIDLPLIGQPCLEFQWHHHIPDDIVRKDMVDVLGDLNVVTGILVAFHFAVSASFGAEPVSLALIGMKVCMAYFGQYSHRSAHGAKADPVANWLQRNGLMISKRHHRSHHQEPHDRDFCLVGACNTIVDYAYSCCSGKSFDYMWLSIFIAWTLFDIVVLAGAIKWAAQLA